VPTESTPVGSQRVAEPHGRRRTARRRVLWQFPQGGGVPWVSNGSVLTCRRAHRCRRSIWQRRRFVAPRRPRAECGSVLSSTGGSLYLGQNLRARKGAAPLGSKSEW